MSEKELIKRMVDGAKEVPARADIFAVRRYSLNEMERRAKQLLARSAEACNLTLDRGDWVTQQDRTLIRLPLGARAVFYHASGAMRLVAGLAPMESLFKKADDRKTLTRLVEKTFGRLKLDEGLNPNESLQFERLWQIKASATNPKGRTVQPVLCRIVGAYRHFVGEYPVLGAASVAVKLAAGGNLDSLFVQIRETTGEAVDQAKVLRPDHAARQILAQLSGLMGNSKYPASEFAVPQFFRFGYLSLPKRKAQRLLAPVYVAAFEIKGAEERQGYFFATPATEKTYLPLCLNGSEARTTPLRTAGQQPGQEMRK
jgi:hypothetical protein